MSLIPVSTREKVVSEIVSLNHQYLETIDHECFSTVKKELLIKLAEIRNQVNEIKERQNGNVSFEHKTTDTMQPNSFVGLKIKEDKIIERCERTYVFLERIAIRQAKFFSDPDKAGLRRARADIQRIRLWLLDVAGTQPSKN